MTRQDDLNRIYGYLNRLNAERRKEFFAVEEVRFLELTDRKQQKTDAFSGYGKRRLTTSDCSGWEVFSCGDTWGGPDYHCIFAFPVTITGEMAGREIGVSVDTGATDIWNTDNPQMMVYINGELTCAMDLNHNEVILSDCAEEGQQYDVRLYSYVNSAKKSNFLSIHVFAVCREAEQLYYDMKTPLEAAALLRPEDDRREHLLSLLHQAGDLLDLRARGETTYTESLRRASAFLHEKLYKNQHQKDGEQDEPQVYAIGHTHIDIAWKWPLRQTREKAVRSFSTVLYLMERYPDYRFMSSQPQLYQYVKEEEPELYEKIKERVREGRWEVEGAMWLESDCNLTGGESLIRQILMGRKFFREEFGAEKQQILWLPDAFGFLGALPQIMKKSGISYFMTTKMGWNDSDQQPDDTFCWEGIDGSRVTGMYVTTKDYETYPERFAKPVRETTYNGRQNANQIMGTWQNYRNKRINNAVMTLYGYGDGGGGPTAGMLEESRRLTCGLPGVPRVKLSGVAEYLERLKQNLEGKELNTWYGDLYLEYHRGTFTSIGENKKNNRKCEYQMQEAEWLAAFAWMLAGNAKADGNYPQAKLEEAWKLLLVNQFHDILPGSAIGEVYEQSAKDYARIRQINARIEKEAKAAILAKAGLRQTECGLEAGQEVTASLAPASDSASMITVWNPLSFAGKQVVELPQTIDADRVKGSLAAQRRADGRQLCLLELPAKGYRTFAVEASEDKEGVRAGQGFAAKKFGKLGKYSLKTPYYNVSWNDRGELTSLYDREAGREVLQQDKNGNVLRVYEDIPKDYDAWNIDSYYERKCWQMSVEEPCRLAESGEICAVLRTKLAYRSSLAEQEIIFYAHTRRIDFRTKIDWKEQQQLVKVSFPIDVMTRKASCEIPFGITERPTHRNTSWDRARFEMCAHRFVDLSEPDYGAALLNDCKYGYSVKDSELSLTLLTSGIFPYPDADKGVHTMTYSLLPHMGDCRSGHVVQEAYLLNQRPSAQEVKWQGTLPQYSMFQLSKENVFADTVKRAEDGSGLIVRMYEAYGQRTQVQWELCGIPCVREVQECDLMEQPQEKCRRVGNTVEFEIKPFEIKTFLVSFEQ